MSENKDITLVPDHDLTMKDLEKVEKFKENGMLGLHTLDPNHVERAMALYLEGKTYRQISNVLKVDRTIILFLSHKFKWWELRKEYLDELHTSLKDKVLESKLQSQEFLLHLTLAYQKKIGRDVDKYLRSDDVKYLEDVDSKDLSSLLKIIELLHRLNVETYGTPGADKSLVSLNGMVGEGVNITRTGANSVEITPKSPFKSKLKEMADFKRNMDKVQEAPKSEPRDITSNAENPKPESKENEKIPS